MTQAGPTRVTCAKCGRSVLLADALLFAAWHGANEFYHAQCAIDDGILPVDRRVDDLDAMSPPEAA